MDYLPLNNSERDAIDRNVHFEFLNDLTDDRFLDTLDGFLQQRPTDLLWINPYSAYLGSDVKDDHANTRFLRNRLSPILTKHKCAAIIIHHTPKTNYASTDKYKASDWMYRGAGAAVLTNWARAYLVIDPCGEGVYKFIAAKRGQRIGWDALETYWAHSLDPNKLLWVPATKEQISVAGKLKTADHLLQVIPVDDPIPKRKIQELAKTQLGIGRDKAASFLDELVDAGKVSVTSIPRSGTNPEKRYHRNQTLLY
jgi:hypothetical protein